MVDTLRWIYIYLGTYHVRETNITTAVHHPNCIPGTRYQYTAVNPDPNPHPIRANLTSQSDQISNKWYALLIHDTAAAANQL